MIYLDNGATSMPKPETVVRSVTWAMKNLSSPSRGSSSMSRKAEDVLYRLRKEAGEMFGCPMEHVVLTTSATHGLNIAIKSLVRPGQRVVISCMEHNAVVRPLHGLGVDLQIAKADLFDSEGLIKSFDKLLNRDTALCVMTHVSNVFGWILPVEAVAELCRKRGIPFILDASQSAGILDVDMESLGASFVAMPGHKGLLGPQGTGLLLCREWAEPILEGGTGSLSKELQMPDFLPDRLEAGTHNMPGAAGLLAGLQYLKQRGIHNIHRHEMLMKEMAVRELENIQNLKVFSHEKQTGVLSLLPLDRDPVVFGEQISEQYNIALRAGLHCAPVAHSAAGTLETGTIRISFGPFNSREDVRFLARILRKELRNVKKP